MCRMSIDTGTLGLRSWNSLSAIDFSKVKSFSEKAWLGRSISCPAKLCYLATERANDLFLLGRISQDGGEREPKKLRTSREDSYDN